MKNLPTYDEFILESDAQTVENRFPVAPVNELDANGNISNPDYEALYDKLVPGSGPAETVEGEMLRAVSRIIYRYFNDGDFYYKGYGKETAGPAHRYLTTATPIKRQLASIFAKAKADAPRGGDDSPEQYTQDDGYSEGLQAALDAVVAYVKSKGSNLTPNTDDMLKHKPDPRRSSSRRYRRGWGWY